MIKASSQKDTMEHPRGFDNCCELDGLTKPEVIHAEANAILKVARSSQSTEGTSLCCTTSPCIDCAKLIIQAGITHVFYSDEYRDSSGIALLRRAGVIVTKIKLP